MKYKMEELVPIVAALTEQYTSGESSSITYEKANQLMAAVLYCIRENGRWETPDKNDWSARNRLLAKKQLPAKQAYEAGYHKVVQKAKMAMELYHNILERFDAYENRCLKDTVLKGMPEFFKWYDPKFAPQDTILTLDYPILTNISAYQGIDAIYLYLKSISYEQLFLGELDKTYIMQSLQSYHTEYKDMIENLCQIVYTAVICSVLIGKDMDSGAFSKEEKERLKKVLLNLTEEELIRRITDITNHFVVKYYEENKELLEYLSFSIPDMAKRLQWRSSWRRKK